VVKAYGTSLLSGEPAAIDRKNMAVHKIGGFRGEEDDRAEKII
jgi:hypothetical protein